MIIKNYADQAQAITMPNNKPVTTHQLLTQVTLVNILVLTILSVVRYLLLISFKHEQIPPSS